MGSMMTGLYVGLSGLQTSNNALNTTANNLTNAQTQGYVRQQVINRDMIYNFVNTSSGVNRGQSGLGVAVQTINHVRDIFLDVAYRREAGRQNFYDKLYDSIYEIEVQMGMSKDGIDGIGFQSALTDLREAVNKLTEAPGELEFRATLVQRAVEFVDKAQLVYSGLAKYQRTLDDEVVSTVNRINQIGDEIKDLNRRIARVEAPGVEVAADLRDQRDLLLDELATYCKISYKEETNGVVEVSVEGVPFADEYSVNYMGYELIEGDNFAKPIWTQLANQPVYTLTADISTEDNTDIGGLKGLLIARGELAPTAGNMTEPDPANYPGGAADPEYIDMLAEYQRYERSYETSAIVNTMANFDKLFCSIVENLNNVFCPETTYTAADGTAYTVLDTSIAPTSKDGVYGTELFTRNFTDRYKEQVIDGQTMYVRNDRNTFGNLAEYSVMNVTVNSVIRKDYSQMALTRADGADDYKTAAELLAVFSKDTLTYNGGLDGLTFEEFFSTMTADSATTGKIYKSMANNEAQLAAGLDNRRQEIMGVSSDEELGNMIKYQQAYNAASRYINVVSEMIETLIHNTGVR
ncbi:MAG: flagellar hook-associated protein FlgK [Butyrivibrio sp.]|nr:flagellar hook-associated protein FlgK [Butyrivibrio sp.]